MQPLPGMLFAQMGAGLDTHSPVVLIVQEHFPLRDAVGVARVPMPALPCVHAKRSAASYLPRASAAGLALGYLLR